MRSFPAIAVVAVSTLVFVFAAIVVAWRTASGEEGCQGDSCAIELAAFLTSGLFVVAVIAAVIAGLVAFFALRARLGPRHPTSRNPN